MWIVMYDVFRSVYKSNRALYSDNYVFDAIVCRISSENMLRYKVAAT